jgi:hypothetical protein
MRGIRSIQLAPTAKLMLATVLVSSLAACGGSDYTPPGKTLAITGTAAIGKALGAATVTATCASGTGTATSAANGTYSVTVAAGTVDAAGPCVLSTTSGATTLRSFAIGSGVANITPMTDMLFGYVLTQTGNAATVAPATLVNNNAFRSVLSTPTVLNASVNQVIATIRSIAGNDVNIPGDFLGGSLVAASGGAAGNAQDQLLDILLARNVVSSTGAPGATVTAAIKSNAGKNMVTGATGGN